MSMRRFGILGIGLFGLAGCGASETAEDAPSNESGEYVLVWAMDADGQDNDFLAVLDAAEDSPTYGELVSTVQVDGIVRAHHTEHVMPEGDRLFVNGFRAGRTFVINVADPRAPFVEAEVGDAGPYTYPHSFERTPEGNVLATFQNRGDPDSGAGGLVELDPLGRYLRGTDAVDAVDPELRPYSLAPVPSKDLVVTTTADMWGELEGRSIQLWRLSDLSLVQTLLLPPGPRGDEHLDVAEARLLEDGETVIVTTFRCGMYTVRGLDGDAPQIDFVYSFPFESFEVGDDCSLPFLMGHFWVQTVARTRSLVVLDLSDPLQPRQVSELVLGEGYVPHWISGEVDGDRLVLTGGGEALQGRVVLLHLDRETGGLELVDGFRAAGAALPGADMRRDSWPHGETGPAMPHGAVFYRK
jgi:hypothetical protein